MANWSGGAAGALGGAASGATLGSIVPGIGTAIGAGVGGLAGLLSGLFTGSEGKFKQTPNKFSPQQQQALNMLLTQGQQGLQNPLAGFAPIEQEARSRFQSQSLPGLAERFTALGGSSTAGSSDFAGMLSGAQSQFDQGIAALKAQYGMQNQQNALQLLQLGLEPQQEWYYDKGTEGVGPQLLSSGLGAAGHYFGSQALANKVGGTPGSTQISGNELQRILAVLRSR